MNRKEVMKRIIAGILSAAMVFGESAPVLLAQETGTDIVEEKMLSEKAEAETMAETGSVAEILDDGQEAFNVSDTDAPMAFTYITELLPKT